MNPNLRRQTFKKALLGSVSVLAVSVVLGVSGTAMAADATSEITDGGTVTATDAAGLLESNETGTVTVTIDPGGNITLGADNADAVTITEATAATNLWEPVRQE